MSLASPLLLFLSDDGRPYNNPVAKSFHTAPFNVQLTFQPRRGRAPPLACSRDSWSWSRTYLYRPVYSRSSGCKIVKLRMNCSGSQWGANSYGTGRCIGCSGRTAPWPGRWPVETSAVRAMLSAKGLTACQLRLFARDTDDQDLERLFQDDLRKHSLRRPAGGMFPPETLGDQRHLKYCKFG